MRNTFPTTKSHWNHKTLHIIWAIILHNLTYSETAGCRHGVCEHCINPFFLNAIHTLLDRTWADLIIFLKQCEQLSTNQNFLNQFKNTFWTCYMFFDSIQGSIDARHHVVKMRMLEAKCRWKKIKKRKNIKCIKLGQTTLLFEKVIYNGVMLILRQRIFIESIYQIYLIFWLKRK